MEQASKNPAFPWKPGVSGCGFLAQAQGPGELPGAFQLSRPAEPSRDFVRATPIRLLPCVARLGLPGLWGSCARGPGTHTGLAAPRGSCLAGRGWGTSLDIQGLPLN